ncbi:MAG: PLP-dependent aminotransferase family protein [Alphaproteobacteria bacterium]|nr:PLP-dependent aminotransferase family protein [Alphaproteobacteria bacterium]
MKIDEFRPRLARWTGSTNRITQHMIGGRDPSVINLSGGLPAPEVYPLAAIAAATQRALARFGAQAVAYGPVEGMPALRSAIAARLSGPRQKFSVANVLITTGSLQGVELLGKILLEPGETILAQHPTYLGALDAWRPREPSYRILDWNADEARLGAELRAAKFAYVVPNFSNPTGALVPVEARERLVRAGRTADTVIVEDDPYGALFYDGDAPPSALELSGDGGRGDTYRGPVVYLGTLSKTVAPGLRIGWAVGDPSVIAALSLAKQGADLCTSTFNQAVALELLEAGVERETLPAMIARYRARRDAIVTATRQYLHNSFEFTPPSGGMFLWLKSRDPAIDTDALWQAALAEGVMFCPSSVFDPSGRDTSAIRLNFTLNEETKLVEGVRRLAAALQRRS